MMASPEFARVEYSSWHGQGSSTMRCPCGASNRHGFLLCDHTGHDTLAGPCLKCWTCGRIITADGAVIGRVEVTA